MARGKAQDRTRREQAAESMRQAMRGKRVGEWMPSIAAWAVEFECDQNALGQWLRRHEPKVWARYMQLRDGYAERRRERILRAYAAGEQIDAIEKREGIASNHISQLAKKSGLAGRRALIDWAALLEEHAEQLTDRMDSVELAEVLGVKRCTLTQAVHRGTVPGWQVIGVKPHAYQRRGCLLLGRTA